MRDQRSEGSELALHHRLAAAAGASVVAAVVTNPLEVLKTRLQTQAVSSSTPKFEAKWVQADRANTTGHVQRVPTGEPPVLRRSFRPPLTTFQILQQVEGVSALWKGIRPSLLASAPTVGIYMPLYDVLRDDLRPVLGGASPLIAGSLARTVAVFCVAPLELLRDIPFTMIFWTLTENMRGSLLKTVEESSTDTTGQEGINNAPSPSQLLMANAISAFIAGGVAAAATTPFDVIKTTQQTSTSHESLSQTARRIIKRSGMGGLWAGIVPRVGRAAPASAMVISTYELLKQQLLLYQT